MKKFWFISVLSPSFLNKKDISLLIGNALDHFDTALYSFLAPVLAPIFFPNYEPVVQLILAYSVLATSLVTRPIGVLIFATLASRIGPLATLWYSLFGMSIFTVSLGFLPGFQEIGWMAPAGLILIRTLRGIFAAGENTIARLYIMENKARETALRASHFYESSTMFGIIFASFLATLVIIFKDTDCWRLTFCLGGFAGLVGYSFRRMSKKEESTSLPKQIHMKLSTTFSLFWQEKINILRIALTASLSYITYSVPFIFMNSFVPLVTEITLETMMAMNTSLLIFDLIVIPFVGQFVTKYDLVKTMIVACSILALTIIPLFQGLAEATLPYVIFVRIWIAFWGIVFLCPLNLWRKMFFSGPEQYLLTGMGNTLGASSIGRLTPAIGLWLWHSTELVWLPACYITLILIAVIWGIASSEKSRQYALAIN